MAGSGLRFGGSLPKQFQYLCNKEPLFITTLDRLFSGLSLSNIILVVPSEYRESEYVQATVQQWSQNNISSKVNIVSGGANRHASFLSGANKAFEIFGSNINIIVHDSNRPFLSKNYLNRIDETLLLLSKEEPCYIPVVPVVESVCMVSDTSVTKYLPREDLFRIQTPQLIYGPLLKEFLISSQKGNFEFTDEGSFFIYHGLPVKTYEGDMENIKITYGSDISR